MMSSQTVPDRVNKFRYGVLVGNFAEEAFGLDHANKEFPQGQLPSTSMRAAHRLENSLHNFHPTITPEDKKTQTFYKHAENVDRGAFIQPETESTYNIFYRKQVHRRVPVLENNCKKEQRHERENRLYETTKTKLQISNMKWPYTGDSVMINDPNGIGRVGDPENDAKLNLGMALTGAIMQQMNIPDAPPGQYVTNVLNSTGKIPPVRAKSLNPFSTHTLVRPEVKKIDEVDYAKLVLPHEEGEQRDILFGHGLEVSHFHNRQFATTYDLSYNQKIKPQTQINSFFSPDLSKTAKEYHKQWSYEKSHQPQIPDYNDKQQLKNDKIGRPYAPYTKTFDHNHMKTEYLRK